MSNLAKRMLKGAVEAGLCKEHTEKWNTEWSVRDLLSYYKANPNWCMERKFPSLDIMKRYQDPQMGIFVDKEVVMRATDLSYVFINCTAGIMTSTVTRLYFSLDSIASIMVEDGGSLVVDSYDNTELGITLKGNARCVVYRYGKNKPTIIGSDNYIIRDKRK